MGNRVVHINVTANWGSTGRICEGICNVAEGKGWDTYIAYGRHLVPGNTKTIKIGTKLGIYKHLLATRVLDRHGLCSKSATKIFIDKLAQLNPGIIHLHNIHGYYINYPLLFDFIKMSRIPVVWTLHDCWPFTGHCVYFEESGCDKWISGCGACPQLKSYPKSICLDRSKNNWIEKKKIISAYPNITFVPVSHWLDGFLKKSFFSNYSSQVIHNGIDLDTFRPIYNAKNIVYELFDLSVHKYLILGVASRWDKRKGFDDFIKLSELLDKSMYQCVIVGVDDNQLRNLPKHVIGIRRTDRAKELAVLYSAADLYVNPTYSDTYPTTNLEAMACGTPVITYETGGSPESITAATGCIVPQGNIEELVNTIVVLCASNQTLIMGERCRAHALTHFSREKCFAKYLDIYEGLLEG